MAKQNDALILQPFGIGDIIFTQTIVSQFHIAGHKIIWPVQPQFIEGLQRAYPHIQWTDVRAYWKYMNIQEQRVVDNMLIVPLRWGVEINQVPYKQCMSIKYEMYGMDYHNWKLNAGWQRDSERETSLYYDVLKLKDGEEFALVNRFWRSDSSGCAQISHSPNSRSVEMQSIEGYSIFDWAYTMERASQIHTVSTAIFYLLEILDITAPIHLYPRLPEEKDFKNIDYLFTKNYKLHLRETPIGNSNNSI